MAPKRPRSGSAPDSHLLFLGVDGGGTKTHIALMNAAGKIACEGFAGPSNPLRVGVQTAVANILKAISDACDRSGLSRGDIEAATLGLAGVRRADIRQRIRDTFMRQIRVRSVEVMTDAEIAWYATTQGKPGIVVIAGTGSVCFGKNEDGVVAVSGGWGPLAGDEGGGVGIARDALHAVAKASDGRGAPTKLSKRASEYFRAAGPDNLIVAIYSPQVDNARIAGFARDVAATAEDGDRVAREIIAEAGRELGIAAAAVIKKLKLERKKIPIGCVGSVFKAGEILTGPMTETVAAIAPKAYLTEPAMPPAHAAALMALREYAAAGNGRK